MKEARIGPQRTIRRRLLDIFGVKHGRAAQRQRIRLRVLEVDSAPEELYPQTPFEIELLREIPGSDRPDYWLAVLARPLRWLDEGREWQITHLIVGARLEGDVLRPRVREVAINIAYVVDMSLLDDAVLDFAKFHYAAVGTASAIDSPN